MSVVAPPDGYLPRRKDRVLVIATVKHNVDLGEDSVFVEVDGSYSPLSIPLENIKSLVSRNWEVGDRVLLPSGLEGTIIAVHDDAAWVLGAGLSVIMQLKTLVPAPVHPEAPPAGDDAGEVALPPLPERALP